MEDEQIDREIRRGLEGLGGEWVRVHGVHHPGDFHSISAHPRPFEGGLIMPQWNGRWSGGRTYLGKDGRTIFWLDRSWNGKRYGIALDVGSKREAEAELALFLRDPSAYVERREAKRKKIGRAHV